MGLAAGSDGNLWVVEPMQVIDRITPSGTVTTFLGMFAGGWDIAAGPDGNMWFTSDAGINRLVIK